MTIINAIVLALNAILFVAGVWFVWSSKAQRRHYMDALLDNDDLYRSMHSIMDRIGVRVTRERFFGMTGITVDDAMVDRIRWLLDQHLGENGHFNDEVDEVLYLVGRPAPEAK